MLAGLRELENGGRPLPTLAAVPPAAPGEPGELLPLEDVRAQLVAIEAAIGAIGASLGRVVCQLGEVRAMLDEA